MTAHESSVAPETLGQPSSYEADLARLRPAVDAFARLFAGNHMGLSGSALVVNPSIQEITEYGTHDTQRTVRCVLSVGSRTDAHRRAQLPIVNDGLQVRVGDRASGYTGHYDTEAMSEVLAFYGVLAAKHGLAITPPIPPAES